jgi:7-alpha-hydroxysteroid dehydrogenase
MSVLARFRLDGRVALVSGAGRGIGRAIALALAEAGADVAVSARTALQVEAVAGEARALGRRALALPCDVNVDAQLVDVVARAVAELGRLDVLVNVAGGTPPTLAAALSPADLDAAFHFNVTSAFRLTQLALPHLLRSEAAAVLNISSALSHYVESGFVAYGAAKAALSHLTRLLAYEYAPRVRCNALAVGAVETDALAPFLEGMGLRPGMLERTPMARLGQPEDVGAAALYLCSPASSWVTGKVFEVDGGTVASSWPMKIKPF